MLAWNAKYKDIGEMYSLYRCSSTLWIISSIKLSPLRRPSPPRRVSLCWDCIAYRLTDGGLTKSPLGKGSRMNTVYDGSVDIILLDVEKMGNDEAAYHSLSRAYLSVIGRGCVNKYRFAF